MIIIISILFIILVQFVHVFLQSLQMNPWWANPVGWEAFPAPIFLGSQVADLRFDVGFGFPKIGNLLKIMGRNPPCEKNIENSGTLLKWIEKSSKSMDSLDKQIPCFALQWRSHPVSRCLCWPAQSHRRHLWRWGCHGYRGGSPTRFVDGSYVESWK